MVEQLWDRYKDWSLRVKTELKCEQLWDIVKGSNEPPKPENDDPAFMAWSHKNDKALHVIKHSCGKSFLELFNEIRWMTDFEFLTGDGNNYLDWSLQMMKPILTDRQLWDIVEGINDPHKAKKNDMALANIERLHSIPAIIKRLISNPTVIKRLDDVDNYKDWSLQVKTYLTDQQLWDIVEGTNEPSKAENDEDAFKAWS
nr:hypothetical protein CFP56_62943 [Quercus suber]